MATKLERTFRIDAPKKTVMDTMRDPAFIEKSERSREALEVRIEAKTDDGQTYAYDIHTKTYARTVKGIDRSKTDDNKTSVTWDLEAGTGSWQWFGPHGPKVVVTGGYRLADAGDGCDLTMTVDIDISIPLVGRMVEKKVKAGFEENWPGYISLIRDAVTA